jgi:hypothetical protein
VGKAVQITVAYSPEYQPIVLPWEKAPAERRESLRVRACQMQLHIDDVDVFVDEKTFDLPLPARLRESDFRSCAEAEARLSPVQRQVLSKEFPLNPEQKLLLAGLGDECADLLRGHVAASTTGQTAIGYAGFPEESGTRYKFSKLAVARFDKAGQLEVSFQGKEIITDKEAFSNVFLGDESQTLKLEAARGTRFVLPGIKVTK